MRGLILIVEDDPKNMKLFRDILQSKGFDTIEATNGVEGVDAAKMHHPKLILMDVQMPTMDGLDATAIIKANPDTATIPIVALTALAMNGDEEKILKAGCDGYITKPIRIEGFLKIVTKFISKSQE